MWRLPCSEAQPPRQRRNRLAKRAGIAVVMVRWADGTSENLREFLTYLNSGGDGI